MALPAQAVPNTLIGNYRILEQIACGGMGIVYKGFDLSLQRTVALKFLTPGHSPDPRERQRLLREARAASALDHENIAAIHHVGETDDGQLFIDMAYYEGEDLACRMRRSPLTTAQAIDVVAQVARGLAHAHTHHVIHRDIKPSNVILTKDGVAKIVDFGLARVVSPEASTLSIDLAGTFAYMSPEQLTSKTVDARSDIWSLGVMFYEILLKRPPFCGGSTASVLHSILNTNPGQLDELPPKLRVVISRALEKEPARRYQSATEFLRDLDEFVTAPEPASRGSYVAQRIASRLRPAWRVARWGVAFPVILLLAMLYPPVLNRVSETSKPPATTPAANELYQQGLVLLERYDKTASLDGAIAKFEQTVKADPNFALAYAALGEAYVDRYRQEQDSASLTRAEEYCQIALRLNNQLPEVYVTMGRIHDLSGKHDLGLQEILRGLKLDSLNVKGLLALGDAYANVSRNEEAEQAYTRAIALRQDNWDAYMRHGSFYIRLRQFEEAAVEYRKAVELVPDNPRAHSNVAAALLQLSRFDEAESEMKLALRYGRNYTTYYNLAYLYYSQQRFAEAADMAEKAAELNREDYRVWQMLGVTYEWIGKQKKAHDAYAEELKALLKSEKVKAEDAEAQVELGLLYSKLERRVEAMRHLNTALALAPENAYVLAVAGETYENFKDRQRAITYIEKAIQNGWSIDRIQRNPDMRVFLKDPEVQKRLGGVSPLSRN